MLQWRLFIPLVVPLIKSMMTDVSLSHKVNHGVWPSLYLPFRSEVVPTLVPARLAQAGENLNLRTKNPNGLTRNDAYTLYHMQLVDENDATYVPQQPNQ